MGDKLRQTLIMVEADVEIMYLNGYVDKITISDIPCQWLWDEMSREAAEYWAVWEYIRVDSEITIQSIKAWVGSPVKKVVSPFPSEDTVQVITHHKGELQ